MSAGVRKVARNSMSILASDVVSRASTFVLYALIGRYLGAYEFGQMSLALTLFYTFQVFGAAGLKTLATREVARDPTKAGHYLLTGSLVVVIGSSLSIAALAVFVRAIGYGADTANVILLLSLALLPASLAAVSEGVFQAREQMHYIALATVPVHLAKVAVAIVLLSRGYGLYAIVALLLASYVAIVALEWGLLLARITRPRLRADVLRPVAMARAAGPFLGVDGIVALTASANVVLLSKLEGERSVGFYSAAVQLLVPLVLVYQNVALSVFPVMSRRFDNNRDGFRRISHQLLELLVAIGVPVVIALLFLADRVLTLFYGRGDFAAAGDVLRIIVWTLLLAGLTSVLGQVLYASLRESLNLRIVAVDAAVAVVFGVVLIGQFGLIGAAVAAVVTRLVDALLHYRLVSKLLFRVQLAHLLWRPAAAAAAMAGYLSIVRDEGVLFAAASGTVVYAAVLGVLLLWPFPHASVLRRRATIV
jgi:O-antigen/teichoic acid export membrane protein